MYYICRFSDSWSLYDALKNNSRLLKNDEVEILKNVFPSLLSDGSKILTALKIESVNPNRLSQLPMNGGK